MSLGATIVGFVTQPYSKAIAIPSILISHLSDGAGV